MALRLLVTIEGLGLCADFPFQGRQCCNPCWRHHAQVLLLFLGSWFLKIPTQYQTYMKINLHAFILFVVNNLFKRVSATTILADESPQQGPELLLVHVLGTQEPKVEFEVRGHQGKRRANRRVEGNLLSR